MTICRLVRAQEGMQQESDVGEGEVEVFGAPSGACCCLAWACTSASASTSPALRPRPLTALARRVRSIEFAGPIEHHNNAYAPGRASPCACERTEAGAADAVLGTLPTSTDWSLRSVSLRWCTGRRPPLGRWVAGGQTGRVRSRAVVEAGREDGDGTAREVRRRQRSVVGAASTGSRPVSACSWCGPR